MRPSRSSVPPATTALCLVVAALTLLTARTASAATADATGPPRPIWQLGEPAPLGTWPLRPDPAVVRDFDPPSTLWGAGHRGVDLLARPGQAVRSALPGTVTYAGVLAGRGVVVVSHGTTRTTYEPVVASVEPGTPVGAGDRLGTVARGPSHCAPRTCLHWGWIRGETYLDPLRLVGLGPVRLLPFLGPGTSAPGPSGTGILGARVLGPVVAGPPWRATLAGPPLPAWW